jgi:hypothetical protein
MRSLLHQPRFLGLILLAGVAAAAWYLTTPAPAPPAPPAEPPLVPDPPTPDPRFTFPTPFRNVHPDVQYVGDASCARCHSAIDKSYHAHPMGRSAEWTVRADPIERYGPESNNPFRSGPFEAFVDRNATRIAHRVSAKTPAGDPLPEYTVRADLAVGSGTRGRSYLTVQDGAVWQSPISWYATGSRWNLSPGFDLGNGGRRAIVSDCLFCHVDRVDPIPGSVNRFREPLLPSSAAIGCERCHGPGQLHVAERTGDKLIEGIDTSIVNPRHLPADLRASVCEQCHLQGQERVGRRGRNAFEFRPGLPFEQFVTVFVRHPDLADSHRSVGQFEQMELSRCFTASGGRLDCVTCHDPHKTPPPESRDQFYRGRCLTCHESKGCSTPPAERQARADSCIACHMPRGDSSNVAHASVTDHRIARRPPAPPPVRGLPPGALPLRAYRSGPHTPTEEERERDLGVVLAQLAFKVPPHTPRVRQTVADLAVERLDRSLATWKGDAEAWTALSVAHGVRANPAQFAAALAAVRLAPESETALTELAGAALAVGKFDDSVAAASTLIRMSPTAVEPYLIRATAHGRLGNWERAEDDCRAALRVHPLHPRVRVMLGVCRHHRGDPTGGQAEAETAAGLATSPQQRATILDWYRRETR